MDELLKELEQLLIKYDACILRSANEIDVVVSMRDDELDRFVDAAFPEEIDANDIKNNNYSISHK